MSIHNDRRVKFGQLRIYVLATLMYVAIASLIVIPKLERAHTAHQVQAQLATYLSRKAQPKNTTPTAPAPIITGTPAAIAIDRLHINLPVATGFYSISSNKWTLDSKHVFVSTYQGQNPVISTAQTNAQVFYGHDIPGVLESTTQLVHGDILTIKTQNSYQFRYYYDKDKVVVPTDTSILTEKNTGDPVMLVTCTGTWYQFRHVMYFHLLDVQAPAVAPKPQGVSS